MYFSPQAKERKEDLFDYEEELETLLDIMKKGPMGVVKGQRRSGKTSLLKVAYNIYNGPKAWLDGLLCKDERTLWEMLELKLKQILLAGSLKRRVFDAISKIEVKGSRLRTPLKDIEGILRKEKIKGVLIIDEAQLLAKYHFSKWLAYAYDHLPIHIIISGSQVGVLEKMLGKAIGGESPMRGRIIREITLTPLNFPKAQVFLIEGMAQIGKRIREDEIKEVYSKLGGLIGWLTYYGYYRQFLEHDKAIEKVREKAKEITAEELENLRLSTDDMMIKILDAVSSGFSSWSTIKNYVKNRYSLEISDSTLKRKIDKLIELSFLKKEEKRYLLADPLLKEGLRIVLV